MRYAGGCDSQLYLLLLPVSGVKRELQQAIAREVEQATRIEQLQKQRDDADEKNVRSCSASVFSC